MRLQTLQRAIEINRQSNWCLDNQIRFRSIRRSRLALNGEEENNRHLSPLTALFRAKVSFDMDKSAFLSAQIAKSIQSHLIF